ncbi:MAG: DAK2 domain-containing protein [Oscillospiraceae bacterium]|nr:DAK2 domain-containing protein [Oscillospiraceae bacterium]
MINGSQLRDAIISAANNIANKKSSVDALNVFPVPDGDTGTNMSMTISAGVKELEKLENPTVAETAKTASAALLRGARGNSGVILSLLFRGFSKGIDGHETAGPAEIAKALAMGVEAAYKAVMKPTEGTILTVSRCAAEKAAVMAGTEKSVTSLLAAMLEQAKETLIETPEMLPILKKSGVVDAGGQGFVYILEGMMDYIKTGAITELSEKPGAAAPKPELTAAGADDEEIRFTYCTECIVDKKPGAPDGDELRSLCDGLGDSLVFVEDDSMIKIHVHVNDPGKVLSKALEYGSLFTVKIENMKNQHTALAGGTGAAGEFPETEHKKAEAAPAAKFPYVPVDTDRAYGFVAVCAGKGMTDVFHELGAENVVSGGQTMNPSTEDILAAVQATPAVTVFVLPNNKNIIMAAEQAVLLADREVIVIPSRTVPQGISAMLAVDEECSSDEIKASMEEAMSAIVTGQVTYAARDSDFDGKKIGAGEYLALKDGKMLYTGRDMEKVCVRLVKAMIQKSTSAVTVYSGEDVTEAEAEAMAETLRAKLPSSVEVSLIPGGQPVYYYVFAAE